MRQLFVVGYQMCNVDVAIELLDQDVLTDLIAIVPTNKLLVTDS